MSKKLSKVNPTLMINYDYNQKLSNPCNNVAVIV